MPFKNKTILITGGTGSFGRAFVSRLLQENQCKKVIIFSRDEWKQWEMRNHSPLFQHEKIRYFLGDIRDKQRLLRAFTGVDCVIHAAALKQVPTAEYNPTEFVNTNVLGAVNLIDAAIETGVKQVIALSTDKAVNPINLYGATKLCSDKVFVAGNAYVGERGHPTFSVVRYGNVLGSRGSVISRWLKHLADGEKEIPITDPAMSRFWITIEEAVDFVVKTATRMRGGEIYIPKIPSMRIDALAEAVAPGVPQKIVGIRPGEKLHEVLIGQEDARCTREYKDHYMLFPARYLQFPKFFKTFMEGREGEEVPQGFVYSSDTNPKTLSLSQVQECLKPKLCEKPLA